MEVANIAMIAAIAACAIAIYMYIQQRNPSKLSKEVPKYRTQPVVVTEDGLRVIDKVFPLSPTKFQVKYENTQYSPIYTMTADYCDIVEVDPRQMIFGKERPLYIEVKKNLEIAYNYEHLPTRKLLKERLSELVRNAQARDLTAEQLTDIFKEVRTSVEHLNRNPDSYTKLIQAYGKEKDNSAKKEADLLKLSAGQEGRIQRRTEPIVEVATRRASAPTKEHAGN